MIIIEAFLFVVGTFVILVLALGLSLWLNLRHHLANPFLRRDVPPRQSPLDGENVIEGDYEVLNEKDPGPRR